MGQYWADCAQARIDDPLVSTERRRLFRELKLNVKNRLLELGLSYPTAAAVELAGVIDPETVRARTRPEFIRQTAG